MIKSYRTNKEIRKGLREGEGLNCLRLVSANQCWASIWNLSERKAIQVFLLDNIWKNFLISRKSTKLSKNITKKMSIRKMKILILNIFSGKWNFNIKNSGVLEILNGGLVKLIQTEILPRIPKRFAYFFWLFVSYFVTQKSLVSSRWSPTFNFLQKSNTIFRE